MTDSRSTRTLALATLGAFLAAAPVLAGDKKPKAELVGVEEVPPVSTPASGEFEAKIARDNLSMEYDISYRDLRGAITQSHIHFGQLSVNGGIMVFLCSNLGNGPAGTPACPASPGAVSGVLTPANVVGPNGQGIPPGDFAKVLAAIRSGDAYANVHTDLFPGGEIRGQIK